MHLMELMLSQAKTGFVDKSNFAFGGIVKLGGTSTFIFGAEKSGKSRLALQFPRIFQKEKTKPRILYLYLDGLSEDLNQILLDGYAEALNFKIETEKPTADDSIRLRNEVADKFNLWVYRVDTDQSVADKVIVDFVQEYDIDLIVMDTYEKAIHSFNKSYNDSTYGDVTESLKILRKAFPEVSFIFIDHRNKDGSTRGSAAKKGEAISNYILEKCEIGDQGKIAKIHLKQDSHRYGASDLDMFFVSVNGALHKTLNSTFNLDEEGYVIYSALIRSMSDAAKSISSDTFFPLAQFTKTELADKAMRIQTTKTKITSRSIDLILSKNKEALAQQGFTFEVKSAKDKKQFYQFYYGEPNVDNEASTLRAFQNKLLSYLSEELKDSEDTPYLSAREIQERLRYQLPYQKFYKLLKDSEGFLASHRKAVLYNKDKEKKLKFVNLEITTVEKVKNKDTVAGLNQLLANFFYSKLVDADQLEITSKQIIENTNLKISINELSKFLNSKTAQGLTSINGVLSITAKKRNSKSATVWLIKRS